MKFDSIESYRKDTNLVKALMMGVVFLSLLVVLGVVYMGKSWIEEEKNKKIVIDQNNNAYLATERRITPEERKMQLKDHVRDFYKYFLELDAGNYDRRMNNALTLIGSRGESLYETYYLQKGLERKLQQHRWRLRAFIDSLWIDMENTPVQGAIWGKQKLIQEGGETLRNFSFTFTLLPASITPVRTHGVRIEQLKVFNDQKIEVNGGQ